MQYHYDDDDDDDDDESKMIIMLNSDDDEIRKKVTKLVLSFNYSIYISYYIIILYNQYYCYSILLSGLRSITASLEHTHSISYITHSVSYILMLW